MGFDSARESHVREGKNKERRDAERERKEETQRQGEREREEGRERREERERSSERARDRVERPGGNQINAQALASSSVAYLRRRSSITSIGYPFAVGPKRSKRSRSSAFRSPSRSTAIMASTILLVVTIVGILKNCIIYKSTSHGIPNSMRISVFQTLITLITFLVLGFYGPQHLNNVFLTVFIFFRGL